MKNQKAKELILFLNILISLIFLSCSSSSEQTTKPNASLTNTHWVLRVMNDKKIFTPEGGKEIYMTLTADGNKANGCGGCNNYFTTYSLTGKNIKFGLIAGTEMYCESRMDTEAGFYKMLEHTLRYKISGNNLLLYDSNKKIIAKFEAVYLK